MVAAGSGTKQEAEVREEVVREVVGSVAMARAEAGLTRAGSEEASWEVGRRRGMARLVAGWAVVDWEEADQAAVGQAEAERAAGKGEEEGEVSLEVVGSQAAARAKPGLAGVGWSAAAREEVG